MKPSCCLGYKAKAENPPQQPPMETWTGGAKVGDSSYEATSLSLSPSQLIPPKCAVQSVKFNLATNADSSALLSLWKTKGEGIVSRHKLSAQQSEGLWFLVFVTFGFKGSVSVCPSRTRNKKRTTWWALRACSSSHQLQRELCSVLFCFPSFLPFYLEREKKPWNLSKLARKREEERTLSGVR